MGAIIGEWQRGPIIGRGASATVSIAADRRTGEVFAVKSVEAARAGVLKREQSVLSALSASPYVVSCLGSGVSPADGGGAPPRFDLFLEYAPGGSLADEIRRRGGRCEEPLIRSRAADVLRGLAFAHGAGVAHCDVKGRNVLLGADGRAMLADFGCAHWTSAAAEEASEDGNAGAGEVVIRGTPMFMAPEAARGEAQGAAADIWALGCTVIEMATGAAPWWPHRFADPVAALHHVAHSGGVPEPPAWLSDEGKDFLGRCLVRDPAARWTAEQLLQHPFVAPAAAIDSSSSAAAKGAAVEQRVSPKSILDQGFWEESDSSSSTDDSDSDATAPALTPADRVRALAGDVAPEWTWSTGGEQWITVYAHPGMASDNSDNDNAASPGFEAEVVGTSTIEASEEQIGGEHMGVGAPIDDASSSRGRDHGDASSSAGSRRGNSVISGSNHNEHCTSSGNSASRRRNKKQVIKNTELVNPPESELAAVFSLFQRAASSSIRRFLFFFHLSGRALFVTCPA